MQSTLQAFDSPDSFGIMVSYLAAAFWILLCWL